MVVSRSRALCRSDAGVDQSGEQGGTDSELTPLGAVGGGGLGCHDLVQRPSLRLQGYHALANGDKHVAIVLELRPVTDRTMTGYHDRLVGGG